MKNAKKYIKLYLQKSQESFDKWGYYYPPRTWEEMEAWDSKTFNKYLKDEEKLLKKAKENPSELFFKPKKYLNLLDSVLEFGFLHVFQKMDWSQLNDLIYQVARHHLICGAMTGSGVDYSNSYFGLLCAFAANDFETIDIFLPKEIPLSKGNSFCELTANYIKILYYQQDEFADDLIEKSHKFLEKKITKIESAGIRFYLAFYQRKATELNKCLQELCDLYSRQAYPASKMDKCFAMDLHGLYRFVYKIDADFFEQIEMPKHDCFFQEFEVWQQEQACPKGKQFYIYPQEMNYMNLIFQAQLPKVKVYEQGVRRKEFLMETELFAKELTESIQQLVNL
ncbi:MAG: hypothetical protein N4A49_07680 [Marinifilaceae bacterium]|jgi:hypothetical protein|nr:hypothetical protein [Marinifilaceae bacterium]